jgi:hypothetical protein
MRRFPMALVKPASTVDVKALTLALLVNKTGYPAIGGAPRDQLAPSLQLVSTAEFAPVHASETAARGSSNTVPPPKAPPPFVVPNKSTAPTRTCSAP